VNQRKKVVTAGIFHFTVIVFLAALFCVAQPRTLHALQPGDRILPFQGTSLDGQVINITDLLEKGPVMLVFWASWCPNCAREIPRIRDLLATEAGRKLQVVTINVWINESHPRMERFISKTNLAYPVIVDQESEITNAYEVFGVPTLFIADQSGMVVFRHHFVPDEEMLKELLR